MTELLELALLGRMRMNLGGKPFDSELKSSKARALLCYLMVTGRSHPRQAVATLLWPHLPQSDARRNLRGVVMNLRQIVGSHLLITNDSLAFDHESAHWLDVNLFTAKLDLPPGREPDPTAMHEALTLYRGDFLEDLYLRDAPAFEDWVQEQRSRFRELAVDACRGMASHFTKLQEFGTGIISARRAVSLDPLSEEAWRQLFLLLALNGQRNLALTQFEEFRLMLMEELGVAPAPETEQLLEEIRSGQIDIVTPEPVHIGKPVVSPKPSPTNAEKTVVSELSPFVAGPPLVDPRHFFGRERELKRLFNMFRRLPLQNGAVFGPRRSGKTSLLHFLKVITQAGADLLRPGQRSDWLPSPERYRWIFVDFQDPRLGGVRPLLSYLMNQMELPAPPMLDMSNFLDAVADNLDRPTIILLDEIGVALQRYPELDDAFWESLRSLATNQVGGNLGFVLAGSQSPDEIAHHSGMGSPFFNIFGYAAELGPLSEPAARELVASSPLPFSMEDTDWILTQSGQWPILLQILCRERLLSLEDGELADDWRRDALRQIIPFQRALTRDLV